MVLTSSLDYLAEEKLNALLLGGTVKRDKFREMRSVRLLQDVGAVNEFCELMESVPPA